MGNLVDVQAVWGSEFFSFLLGIEIKCSNIEHWGSLSGFILQVRSASQRISSIIKGIYAYPKGPICIHYPPIFL